MLKPEMKPGKGLSSSAASIAAAAALSLKVWNSTIFWSEQDSSRSLHCVLSLLSFQCSENPGSLDSINVRGAPCTLGATDKSRSMIHAF